MTEDVMIKREKLALSKRSRLVEDLTKALQTPNLSEDTKRRLEAKLVETLESSSADDSATTTQQFVGCTIHRQENAL
jgi:hypothetical protein